MEILYAQWNEKYGEFFVTRWSSKSGRQIQVGKSHPTVQAATKAAMLADKRLGGDFMHFVDCVRPR